MSNAHIINLLIHITSGAVALIIGFVILSQMKGTEKHRKLGRAFSYLTLIVCLSAATGVIFFRFLPPFAALTLLVLYQFVSGWHIIYTKERGPSKFDAIWTLFMAAFIVFVAPILIERTIGTRTIVYSALGSLSSVLLYDTMRWLFPRRWYQRLWRYEHTYKMIAPLFGMFSAFVGNVVRVGQPWSQITPSAVGFMVIGYYFVKLYREDKKRLAL
jgi:uncharacterized membrane protein